jgi:hypothetical protein
MGAAVPSFPAQAEMADLPGFRPELGAKAWIFFTRKNRQRQSFCWEQVKRANKVSENPWISLQKARWEWQDFGGEGI